MVVRRPWDDAIVLQSCSLGSITKASAILQLWCLVNGACFLSRHGLLPQEWYYYQHVVGVMKLCHSPFSLFIYDIDFSSFLIVCVVYGLLLRPPHFFIYIVGHVLVSAIWSFANNLTHAQTVDTRPFSGWAMVPVGPGGHVIVLITWLCFLFSVQLWKAETVRSQRTTLLLLAAYFRYSCCHYWE